MGEGANYNKLKFEYKFDSNTPKAHQLRDLEIPQTLRARAH